MRKKTPIEGYGENAKMTVTGGTFYNFNPATDVVVDYSPSAGFTFGSVVGEGYAALSDLNGNFVVGAKPTATVNNLGVATIPAGDYMVYGNGDNSADMPLSFVMQFLADQDAEDMASSPFADWYGDFVITFTGIEDDSFTADGCYLAGHYGSFGWVKVPVDGMTIEEGVCYPVMLGVGMGQKYDYICSGVEDFKCALYLTPEILEANPNIQVKLELKVVDNSKGSDAAAEALVNNENVYCVTSYEYIAEDFTLYVAQNVNTGKYYETVNEALAEANANETVKMLANDTAFITSILGNVTLDLNGHIYTTTYMVVYNSGNIIDNSESNAGRLVVDSNKLMINEKNAQLPVKTETGYMFVAVDPFAEKWGPNNYYIAQFKIEPTAHETLKGGLDAANVSVFIRVSWTNAAGLVRSQDFEYSNDLIVDYLKTYNSTTGKYGSHLFLILTGTDANTEYTYQVVVKSDTGVEFTSDGWTES